MITINLNFNKLTPEQLEGMLRLFWNSNAVGEYDYRQLMKAYSVLCGTKELDALISEIRK